MGVNRQLTGCPASYSPLPLASAFGSVAAALAIVAALHAKACGVASPRISIEVPLASALLDTLVHNAVETELPPQYRSRRLRTLEAEVAGSAPVDYHRLLELCDPFYSHYQCADGRPFYLVAPSHLRHQQRALAVLGIDASDLVDRAQPYSDGADPRLHLGLGAAQIGDEAAPALRRRMQAAFLRRASFDWERLFGQARVPGIAHRTTAEWMASSHAIESGLAACGPGGVLSPGPAAWVLEFPEAVARTKAPRAASQPVADAPATATPSAQRGGCAGGGWLSGVRVLDLSNVIAGPTIGSMLARYGADVTKVDHPQPTYAPDVTVVYGLAANRGKRSVLLDITDTSAPPGEPTGRQALEALVARVDLVIVRVAPSASTSASGV